MALGWRRQRHSLHSARTLRSLAAARPRRALRRLASWRRPGGEPRWRHSSPTSRRRRWIIPKGWPKKGKSPYHSAAREAFEEAGVVGAVAKRSVGSFSYEKRLKNGGTVVCETTEQWNGRSLHPHDQA